MRLDHLLSREKAKPERVEPKPRSIRRKATERKRNFFKKKNTRQRRQATQSVAASELKAKARRTLYRLQGLPEMHLDNCTAKKRFRKRPVAGLRNQSGKEAERTERFMKSIFNWSQDRKIDENQATKSTGWMPWHHTPKKDVASCEKLRGAASRH